MTPPVQDAATDPNPPVLAIQNLRVSIDEKRLLHDVSLSIKRGEIMALTGESGSGKSLTALAIMQLLSPRMRCEGAITLDGQTLTDLPDQALCALRGQTMGMVFQEPMTALNPLQTIGAQVAETFLIHGTATAAQARGRATEALSRAGLPPETVSHDRYPHALSGGQRQRVVIALAIAMRPKLLIADEPTTALDVTTQAQILTLLRDLARTQGMALLMITHDLAVVHDLADTIAVMKDGAIVETGPTRQVFSRMTHPYTRALFEASRHRAKLHDQPAAAPLLQVKGVSRTYRGARPSLLAKRVPVHAVRDVSFDIAKGERVGLVGESGCGKSTLTRAILGLDPVTAGTITLDGQPVLSAGKPDPAIRRRMQVVFQDPYSSFNPRHSVSRLITEPFHLFEKAPKGAARDTAIAEALTAVGLSPDDRHKTIHAFSGGQRQRLAIARALITRPDLIVFDEAVSALDVRVRAQILDLIASLSRAYGLTYLFISHDLSVVRGITDRVLVMRAGAIVEHGATDHVFDAPSHPYTKDLIAAAPRLPDHPVVTHAGDTDAAPSAH